MRLCISTVRHRCTHIVRDNPELIPPSIRHADALRHMTAVTNTGEGRMRLNTREQRIVLLYFHDPDRLTDTEYTDAVRILRLQDAMIGWSTVTTSDLLTTVNYSGKVN